jgi:two-component system sensor histidine kinase UhpB
LEKEIVDRLRIEKRINATNELLENMFSNVHVMIAYMDRNFNFIRVNRTYAAADDRNPEFFVGKNHFDLYPNEENEAIFRNVVETGTPFSTYGKPFVYAGYPERGTTYWDWSLQPVRDTEGEVMGLVLSLVNVTDQYLALEALRKSEGHFRALIENALDIVVILNTEGRIRYSSPSLETTLGYRQEDLLGRDVFELVHPDDVPSMVLLFGQVLAHPEGRRATSVRIRHKDGSWRILEGKGKRLETEPGSIVVNAWDITLLKATEQHLRDLAEHLITVREEERGRIAREVHDELGQLLTALKMDLAWVDKKVPSHNEALRERTRSMLELINEITKAVRKISSELRPALLDNLGLIPALEWQCREFQERTGITCDAHLAVKDVAMEAERATHIFRMFQEALTNVARHSEATKVKISVNSSPDGVLELEIEDNGKGIEEKNFLNPRSFGLIGMQERVAYLGGNMEIKGIAGEGTTISIIVPFVSDRIR